VHENDISHAVIGAAMEVHREVGPGIIEKPYEEAMCHELHLRGLPFVRQKAVPFVYKGVQLSVDLRTDLIVAGKVIVDLKAKEQVTAIDKLKF
jgi:GxxExxY protein